jgi:hypothetical protein
LAVVRSHMSGMAGGFDQAARPALSGDPHRASPPIVPERGTCRVIQVTSRRHSLAVSDGRRRRGCCHCGNLLVIVFGGAALRLSRPPDEFGVWSRPGAARGLAPDGTHGWPRIQMLSGGTSNATSALSAPDDFSLIWITVIARHPERFDDSVPGDILIDDAGAFLSADITGQCRPKAAFNRRRCTLMKVTQFRGISREPRQISEIAIAVRLANLIRSIWKVYRPLTSGCARTDGYVRSAHRRKRSTCTST